MAYRKPNVFVRKVFNPIAMRFGMSDSHTLAIKRRRSGELQRIPVIPLEHDGAQYLVSVRGESDWVKNLRAAGEGELSSKRGARQVAAVEVPPEQCTAILEAYQAKAGKAVESHFKAMPDAADHPVFRLDPKP